MPSAERQFPGPQICLRQSRALGVFNSHICACAGSIPLNHPFSPPKLVASCSTPLRWPGPGKSVRFFEEGGSCRPGHTAANNRVMEFQDKVLKCVDCGKDFVF